MSRFWRALIRGGFALVVGMGLPGISAAAGDTLPAAEQLVQRVTPEFAGRVRFRCEPGLKQPTIQAEGTRLLICADSKQECIRAYGYYLRHMAGVHLSWNGDCREAADFALPEQPVQVPPTLPLNFAYNYTALCYTAAHWDEKRWMQELDRLALNGVRYAMVTAGLEKVWQGFLQELGYPADKIRSFIPSPCYAAWWHMGNLEGEGGPVSPTLIESEARLGRKIVEHMRELGIEPVLQGYVGLLPHDFRKYAGSIVQQGRWCGYQRPAVLRPDTPDFPPVAALWYKHLRSVYGYSATAYAGDLFHEGGRVQGINLEQAAAAVQQAMQQAAPGSIWFIQAWGYNPLPKLLAGTSVQHTVILALHKDLSPRAELQRRYGGRRYVWCELANFGGKHGLYGGFDLLEKMPADAAGASGLGLLSEGLETNPVYYALFWERVNSRAPIDRADFLARYARARYASRDPRLPRALSLLASSVYTPNGKREGGLENIICARPDLSAQKATTWSNPTPYYAPEDVRRAGKLLLEAAQQDPALAQRQTFRYDLADVCRQVLGDKARAQLARCRAAADRGNTPELEKECRAFCGLIEQTADLLATHEDFLLGAYLRGVTRRVPAADAPAEQRNLRRLITTWRPDTSTLNDYAHRHFSEMMRYYYLPRWQAYFCSLQQGEQPAAAHAESNDNNGERVTTSWKKNAAVDAIERAIPDAQIPLLTAPQKGLIRLAEQILE